MHAISSIGVGPMIWDNFSIGQIALSPAAHARTCCEDLLRMSRRGITRLRAVSPFSSVSHAHERALLFPVSRVQSRVCAFSRVLFHGRGKKRETARSLGNHEIYAFGPQLNTFMPVGIWVKYFRRKLLQ